MRSVVALILLTLFSSASVLRCEDQPPSWQQFPRPPNQGGAGSRGTYYGALAYVTVVFGTDGKVKNCSEWYSGSPELSKYTCDFIRGSWHSTALAGRTVYAQILFGLQGPVFVQLAPQPPYPDFAFATHEEGTVQVGATFDKSGTVTSCIVLSSNVSAQLGEYVCDFILKHWQHTPWRNTKMKIPITYKYAH
jgi:TonB family protein